MRRGEVLLVIKTENRRLRMEQSGSLLVGTELFQKGNWTVLRVGKGEKVNMVSCWRSRFRDLDV